MLADPKPCAPPADYRGLPDLATTFLWLGATAFGGPAAHIALMELELVTRRRWIDRDAFVDMFAMTNLIPGPNSTELALHIGHRLGGLKGMLTAGLCFIAPSFAMVLGLAYAYVRWHTVPHFDGALHGLKPVTVAIILLALARLAPTTLTKNDVRAVFAAALVATLFRASEIAVLTVSGALVAVARSGSQSSTGAMCAAPPVSMMTTNALLASSSASAPSASSLFWFFAKVGSLLFGSGYVLIAFLEQGLVHERGWIHRDTLVDAIAIGQLTPGPVSTAATFIGYVLAGPSGACASTIGIFLPAFLLVAFSGPLIPVLRRSRTTSEFLAGVGAASLALMAGASVQIASSTLVDGTTWALALIAGIVLSRTRINPTWLLAASALFGVTANALRH